MKTDKLVNLIIKFKYLIVSIIPIITGLLLFLAIEKFEFDANVRIWFDKESQIIKDYDNFKANFGTDETVIIAFSDDNGIFNHKALSSIERITQRLWQTKYIARVDSITNYQYVHADKEYPDDILVDSFLEDIKNLSEQELKAKEKIATTDTQTKNLLISEDGTTAVIMARMIPRVTEGNEEYFILENAVKKILDEETIKTGYDYKLHGVPIVSTEFIKIAKADSGFFTPLVLLSVLLLLIIAFRTLSGGLTPLLVVIITFVSVIAVMALMGFKFNNFTANLPVFITAIGIADAVHIYSIWLFARKEGLNNELAIKHTIEKNFYPAFLTSITTFIGFISLAPSVVIPVKTLGITTAMASILAFLLSIVFLPALLAIINPKIKKGDKSEVNELEHPAYAKKYSSFIISHHNKILAFSVAVLVICGIGLAFVKVDSQGIKYFKPQTDIRETTDYIQEKITGPLNLEIIVDSQNSSGVKNPEFLYMVDRFYKDFYQAQSKVKHIRSLLDVIKRFNQVMNADKSEFYTIPNNKELIAQYLLLYSLSLPQGMEINDKMDIDERLFRITASVDIGSSSENMKIINWAKEWWSTTPYSVNISGQNAMYTYMEEDVTKTLIMSISLALTLVLILMWIAFRSFKVLLISILTNAMPIILVVGVMGWLGIDIGLGVAISGAIILGVAVDDTIHFLVKYNQAKSEGKSFSESLEYMITYAGSAIFFTTVVLSVSFGLFLMSEFAPNFNFGVVTAVALILAFLIDIFMLPSILAIVDKRRK